MTVSMKKIVLIIIMIFAVLELAIYILKYINKRLTARYAKAKKRHEAEMAELLEEEKRLDAVLAEIRI